jgi:hypothetical protein
LVVGVCWSENCKANIKFRITRLDEYK